MDSECGAGGALFRRHYALALVVSLSLRWHRRRGAGGCGLLLDADVDRLVWRVSEIFHLCLKGGYQRDSPGLEYTSRTLPFSSVNRRWAAVSDTTTPPGCSCMLDFSCAP